MRKFAFLLMGPQFDPEKHRAEFQVPGMVSYIRTVRDFTEDVYKRQRFIVFSSCYVFHYKESCKFCQLRLY